jgi:hypothetical protein
MERRQTLQCVNTETPAQIESLFARNPLLFWFSIVGKEDVPDNVSRSGDEDLFVGELGVPPGVGVDYFRTIFQDVISAVTELVGEQPELIDSLRGRTFARALH